MANEQLIAAMLRALDEFEAGRASIEQADRAIEQFMGSVEGINLSNIHQASDLRSWFNDANAFAGMDDLIGIEAVSTVLSDLRRFLLSLPGSG